MSHAIDMLRVELSVGNAAAGAEASDRVSNMFERRLRPILAELLDRADDSNDRLRLDSLVVDLGAISPQRFEDDFMGRLESALALELAHAIGRRHRPSADAEVALQSIEVFMGTGCVPWWDDVEDGRAVSSALRRAASSAPGRLLALIEQRASDQVAVARLAAHFDSATLDAFGSSLGGDACAALGQAIALLERVFIDTPLPSGKRSWKLTVWESALAILPTGPWSSALAVVVELLRELIERVPQVGGTLDASVAGEGDWPLQVREALAVVLRDASCSGKGPAHPVTSAAAEQCRPMSKASSEASTASASGPRSLLHEVSPAASMRLSEAATRTFAWPAVASWNAVEGAGAPVLDSRATAVAMRHLRGRRALSSLDHVYVANAGLVLLWPFYRRFFERLELLDVSGAAFADVSCAGIAARALDALATEDHHGPEFRLPLAKLLAGLEPDTGIDIFEPLRSEIATESEYLLESVIEQARDLGAASAGAFRESFLTRPGVITTRDGSWLLQVERREHDVLLRRLRWSWSWVKLPWMAHPLRVEW